MHGYNISFGDLIQIFKVRLELNRSNLSMCGGGHRGNRLGAEKRVIQFYSVINTESTFKPQSAIKS